MYVVLKPSWTMTAMFCAFGPNPNSLLVYLALHQWWLLYSRHKTASTKCSRPAGKEAGASSHTRGLMETFQTSQAYAEGWSEVWRGLNKAAVDIIAEGKAEQGNGKQRRE